MYNKAEKILRTIKRLAMDAAIIAFLKTNIPIKVIEADFWLPINGHYNPGGHARIAGVLEESLSDVVSCDA